MPPDSDHDSDRQLLQSLKLGDSEAAGILVERLTPLISRLVFRLTGWNPDTQDLVQDVFVNIQANSDSFKAHSKLETWVTAIVINRCRNWHRTKARQPTVSAMEINALSEDATTPQVEINESVRAALRQLNPADRELVVLRYLEEKSLDEISTSTGIRKNTIEVKLHRARQKMQAAFHAGEKEPQS